MLDSTDIHCFGRIRVDTAEGYRYSQVHNRKSLVHSIHDTDCLDRMEMDCKGYFEEELIEKTFMIICIKH